MGENCPHLYVVILHHQFLMWDWTQQRWRGIVGRKAREVLKLSVAAFGGGGEWHKDLVGGWWSSGSVLGRKNQERGRQTRLQEGVKPLKWWGTNVVGVNPRQLPCWLGRAQRWPNVGKHSPAEHCSGRSMVQRRKITTSGAYGYCNQ